MELAGWRIDMHSSYVLRICSQTRKDWWQVLALLRRESYATMHNQNAVLSCRGCCRRNMGQKISGIGNPLDVDVLEVEKE